MFIIAIIHGKNVQQPLALQLTGSADQLYCVREHKQRFEEGTLQLSICWFIPTYREMDRNTMKPNKSFPEKKEYEINSRRFHSICQLFLGE